MSLSAIREQIKVILSAVEGVGVVHDYIRWSDTWEKFLELFGYTDGEGVRRINGWMITRVETPSKTASVSHEERSHTIRITGIYGISDAEASEITFQQIIEDICQAFRANYKLNDTADNTEPAQVDLVEPRMFGDALCHYCEISLQADEYEDWS